MLLLQDANGSLAKEAWVRIFFTYLVVPFILKVKPIVLGLKWSFNWCILQQYDT